MVNIDKVKSDVAIQYNIKKLSADEQLLKLEKELKEHLCNVSIQRPEFGSEYFECEYEKLKNIVCKFVDTNIINPEISID